MLPSSSSEWTLYLGNVVDQEISLETQCPEVSLWIGPLDPLCLAGPQISDKISGKQGFGLNRIVCIRHLGTESFLSVRGGGTLPKSKFPDVSWGPVLQTGLSKDSRLGPAAANPFLHSLLEEFVTF